MTNAQCPTNDQIPMVKESAPEAERQRIEQEYKRRAADPALRKLYAPTNPDCLFSIQERERIGLRLLRQFGLDDLSQLKLLDLGCGDGDSILRWLSLGLEPENCTGLDLMAHRIQRARQRLPAAVSLVQGDASQLPFPANSFGLITQFTMFSSILDPKIKQKIAAEMIRVLHPAGLILWFDFWLNPVNRQTRGIRAEEIRSLFPRCVYEFHRINLAPPVARRLAPLSSFACHVLERLKLFNSHYMVGIRPIQK